MGYSAILRDAMTQVKRDTNGGFYFNDLISILKSQVIGGAVSIRKSKDGKISININGEIIDVDVYGKLQNIKEENSESVDDEQKPDIEISSNGKTLKFKDIDFQKTNANLISHFEEMTKITKVPSMYIDTTERRFFNIDKDKKIKLPTKIHAVMPGDKSLHSIILDISKDGKINVIDNGWCMGEMRKAYKTFLGMMPHSLGLGMPNLMHVINCAQVFISEKLSLEDIAFSKTSLDIENIKINPNDVNVFPVKNKGNCLWHSFTTLMNGNMKFEPYTAGKLKEKSKSSSIDLFKTYEKMHEHYKGRVNENGNNIDEKIEQIGTSYAIQGKKNAFEYDQYKIGNSYKPYNLSYEIGNGYNDKLNSMKNYVKFDEHEIGNSYVSKLQQTKFETKLGSLGKS